MSRCVSLERVFEDGRMLFQEHNCYFVLTWEDIQEVVRLATEYRERAALPQTGEQK